MDELQDSYFLLDESAETEFLRFIRNERTVSSDASADLQAALGGGPGLPRIILAEPPRPDHSILDEVGPAAKPRIRDALSIAMLLRHLRTAIATKPISEILSCLGAGAEHRSECGIEITADASRFIAARRLVPFAPNCLTDSLALVQWLGPAPDVLLVFGVKLEPFAAHCWVQFGDLLLNDRADVVGQFRPVRVIECAPATR